MKTIYVDIDGVLANFSDRWQQLFNTPPQHGIDKRLWTEFVTSNQFTTLDLMPDAQQLIDYLKSLTNIKVMILGSTGGTQYHGNVQQQKIKWLAEHDITFDPVFVPGKRYKQFYADPSATLIDDTYKNVTQFIERGGKAIMHINAASTIKYLQMQ
jgi:5'(3')-deoxyribonucleotidase